MNATINPVSLIMIVVGLPALLLGGSEVDAQDWELEPSYGGVDLTTAFEPNPLIVRLVAGGGRSLDRLGFRGRIADTPDFEVFYQAGRRALVFSVIETQGDTVMLIRGPDDVYYYDDDSVDHNPVIRFENPRTGWYTVWVGTFGTRLLRAALAIAHER